MNKKSTVSIDITEVEARNGGAHGHEIKISGNVSVHEAYVFFCELLTPKMDNNLALGLRTFLAEHFGMIPIPMTKQEIIDKFGEGFFKKVEAESLKRKAKKEVN